MKTTLLKFDHISGIDNDGKGLHDIHFSLLEGQTHVVLGADYRELKSFLNLLSGTFSVNEGEVALEGLPISLKKLRNKVQFILLNANTIFNKFSVLDNLLLMQSQLYVIRNRNALEKKVEQLMKEIGVNLPLDVPTEELTQEERKILLFIRVFLSKADIVVIFDSNESVNIQFSEKEKKLLNALKFNKKGVIYLTTQLEKVFYYADQVSLLQGGTLQGTLDGDAARREPHHVLSLFPEWKQFEKNKKQSEVRMADTLFQSIQFMSSKNELEASIKHLAENLAETLGANESIIYIFEKQSNQILAVSNYPKPVSYLKPELLNQIDFDEERYIARNMVEYSDYFTGDQEISKLLLSRIKNKNENIGLIQLSFNDNYTYREEDLVYLHAFGKEIAIIMDYSRLLGNSVLLKETHHRIKNNLQLIISLLNMQKYDPGKDLQDMLETIIRRVKSIATVHDMFAYNSIGMECGLVSLRLSIEKLVQIYQSPDIHISLDLEDMLVSYDTATSMLMVLNELINNSWKYAFEADQQGLIEVSCKTNTQMIYFVVRDSGKGVAADFKLEKAKGLGLSIVQTIMQSSFHGRVKIYSERGTVVQMVIPKLSFLPKI